jgi:hypothetical protein
MWTLEADPKNKNDYIPRVGTGLGCFVAIRTASGWRTRNEGRLSENAVNYLSVMHLSSFINAKRAAMNHESLKIQYFCNI